MRTIVAHQGSSYHYGSQDHPDMGGAQQHALEAEGTKPQQGGIPRRCQCETATAVWHGPHHTNSRMPPNLATQLRSGVTWCTRGPRQPPNCRPWMWAGHCDRRHIATATKAARRIPEYAECTGSEGTTVARQYGAYLVRRCIQPNQGNKEAIAWT